MTIVTGLLAAVLGFCISLYIQNKQQTQRPMMCPRKSPCETVVSSPQSRTFGVSNTVLGMVYYATTFFLITAIGAGNGMPQLPILLAILSTGGFFFSLYLIWVQYFKIRQWCVWCLGSAFAATVLFGVGMVIFF